MGERLTIPSADGCQLAVEHLPAIGPPRGVLLLGHAMMVNRHSMDRPSGAGFASSLAARGYHVYLADMRDHGDSRRSHPPRWSYDDIVFRDLPALTRALASRHHGLPLAIIGHSLVGHAALPTLGLDPSLPVRALVGISTNVWLPALEPRPLPLLEKHVQMGMMFAIASALGYFPARRFRMGPEDVSLAFVRQFARWLFRGTWTSADGRYDFLDAATRLTVPILLVSGGADRIMCAPRSSRAFAALLKGAPVSVRIVASDPHAGLVADHMRLVTDEAAREVWGGIADWLDGALGGSNSTTKSITPVLQPAAPTLNADGPFMQ